MYDQVALVQNQIEYVCLDTVLVQCITAQFGGIYVCDYQGLPQNG